jgi:formylglycine-generating enzyme required for sulfatase activity
MRTPGICAALSFGAKAPEGSPRVNRGGSWNNDASNCRTGYRNANEPANRNDNFKGFIGQDCGEGPKGGLQLEPQS